MTVTVGPYTSVLLAVERSLSARHLKTISRDLSRQLAAMPVDRPRLVILGPDVRIVAIINHHPDHDEVLARPDLNNDIGRWEGEGGAVDAD